MSAATISTRRLESVLRYLANNPDSNITKAATKYLPFETTLAEFKEEIWVWLRKFNMGRRDVSVTRINAVLAQEKDLPPAAKASIETALERKAREPVPAAVGRTAKHRQLQNLVSVALTAGPQIDLAAVERHWAKGNSAPNKLAPATDVPIWLSAPKGPRRKVVAQYRADLERFAYGLPRTNHRHAFELFLRNWFGTNNPSKGDVVEFFGWWDKREPGSKPAPAILPAEAAKPRVSRSQPTPPPVSAAAAPADGWLEIEAVCGGRADYDARYSGAETKSKRLGFTKKASEDLGKLGFAIGKFVRVWWNPKARQLGLTLAGNGFKIRAGKHAFCIAGAGLLPVLGKDPLEFTIQPAVPGYAVVLGVAGGAS